ncbi:MAG: bifunctional pyr operon transcriptional regulator/uracil phosphoribosyltransferase PyrR [Candidatus Hydrogenedentota bacterium]
MTDANNHRETTVVMDREAIDAALRRIAQEIAAAHEAMANVALLGILSRGRPLAERLAAHIEEMTGARPRLGSLATTLYRDDLRSGRVPATVGNETHFDFDIHGMTVILVDDVIAAGRTIRAALDEVIDYGRPQRIQLACLVDRGLRELPIQPDYLGWSVATTAEDHIAVRIEEIDGEDVVLLERGGDRTTDEERE